MRGKWGYRGLVIATAAMAIIFIGNRFLQPGQAVQSGETVAVTEATQPATESTFATEATVETVSPAGLACQGFTADLQQDPLVLGIAHLFSTSQRKRAQIHRLL